MQKSKGYSLHDITAVLLIVGGILLAILAYFVNNPAATENRAYDGAKQFIKTNNISSTRLTCARDSDGDGYGGCAVITAEKEKIYLECPTDFLTVVVFGATSCKEVETTIRFNSSVKR